MTGDRMPLHPEIEVALLRIAQEALANVAKHAGASRAGLTLSYMGDVVTLDVRDDGVGFDVTARESGGRPGFGLTAMRQRVARVAGRSRSSRSRAAATGACRRACRRSPPAHRPATRHADERRSGC